MNLPLEAANGGGDFGAEPPEVVSVDAHAVRFDAGQDPGERELECSVELVELCRGQTDLLPGGERQHGSGLGGQVSPGIVERQLRRRTRSSSTPEPDAAG